jgi:hypothetical protein
MFGVATLPRKRRPIELDHVNATTISTLLHSPARYVRLHMSPPNRMELQSQTVIAAQQLHARHYCTCGSYYRCDPIGLCTRLRAANPDWTKLYSRMGYQKRSVHLSSCNHCFLTTYTLAHECHDSSRRVLFVQPPMISDMFTILHPKTSHVLM